MKLKIILASVFCLSVVVSHKTLMAPCFRTFALFDHLVDVNKKTIRCPPGHEFFLAFGTKTNQAEILSAFHGNFVLTSGQSLIQQGSIETAKLEEANWLDAATLSSVVFKADDANRRLNMKSGQTYDIEIDLENAPVANLSAWLCYVTTRYQELKQSFLLQKKSNDR